MTNVLNAFEAMIASGDLTVVETLSTDARPERRAPIPSVYADGPLREWLKNGVGAGGSLWNHQSLALEILARGDNLVVGTGTASGKSLIFQLAVAQELLAGGGRALVLYPLKALLSDQSERWIRLAREMGLPENTVAEVHGQVLADDRMDAVRNAKVILATPDAIHAWMMRQVALPVMRELLCSLRYLILDEAHIYESVFGSNVAYLLRRLLAARRRACRDKNVSHTLQIIGATATIADPAEHMLNLTGWPFSVVDDADDGSPTHGRTLLHLEGPDFGVAAEAMIVDVCSRLVAEATEGSFIAFHDSRQGVERVASRINDDNVLPYRSGYEVKDRTSIEKRLRRGQLRGVVSTPALELGIDISEFLVGLNVGVPQSKKAFRQRLGRVGRASQGAFAVIAPRHAFTRYGSSFADYYAGSVEPTHLYLGNRFIQFAQARCLMDESEGLGADTKEPPPGVSWPDSFHDVFDLAKPGARKPREFDFISQLGSDAPHFNYPLRQVGEQSYTLRTKAGEEVGTIALNQAIREAYPGATYLHLRKPLHIIEWRSFDRSIRVDSSNKAPPTKPMLRKTVNVGFGPEEIVNGRIRSSASGVLAEVMLQVNESVEGYRIAQNTYAYKDLRQLNPQMNRKQRDFRTTGVVLRITEDWFAGGGQAQSRVRQMVAEALADMLKRERSVSPNDVDHAHTHIAIYHNGTPRRATDTIIIYDSIYGGLRLTETLYDELEIYLAKLNRAAELAGDQAALPLDVTQKLRAWALDLQQGTPTPDRTLSAPEGEFVIYTPGSVVSVMQQGVLLERTLIQPQMLPFGGEEMLVYSYDTGGRGLGMVPHDQVQPTGHEWSMSYWNPVTGVMASADVDDDGLF